MIRQIENRLRQWGVRPTQDPGLEHVSVLGLLGVQQPSGITQERQGVPDQRRTFVAGMWARGSLATPAPRLVTAQPSAVST